MNPIYTYYILFGIDDARLVLYMCAKSHFTIISEKEEEDDVKKNPMLRRARDSQALRTLTKCQRTQNLSLEYMAI